MMKLKQKLCDRMFDMNKIDQLKNDVTNFMNRKNKKSIL